MKRVKRYIFELPDREDFVDEIYEDPQGDWVKHDDYLALYADKEHMESVLEEQNDRLAAEKEAEIKVLRDEADCVREENVALSRENAALAAENERLRKAGDDLERDLFLRMNLNAPLPSSIAEWNAAKEGRDAK